MKEILLNIHENIDTLTNKPDAKYLKDLIKIIRPRNSSKIKNAIQQIYNFIAYMDAYSELRISFFKYILSIFLTNKPLQLYTESGIYSTKGFWQEVRQKWNYKLLPPLALQGELSTVLNEIFYKKDDFKWVLSIPDEIWIEMLKSIGFLKESNDNQSYILNNLLNSALILAQRITVIGLENEISDKLPAIEDLQSPFFGLTKEVTSYVEKYKQNFGYHYINEEDYRQILVMLKQCEESVLLLHRNKDKYGVSLYQTHLILRLEQHIRRLRIILTLIQENRPEERNFQLVKLFKELVEAENTKYNIIRYLSDYLSIISYKIVEHTSQTGKHYISTNKEEFIKLLWAALGGGLIVAFLVCIKTLVYFLHAPKFWEAFFYSINYSLGFIIIHLLHFTLATKQPAMTASTIALSLDKQKGNLMNDSVVMFSQIFRSQMISLLGNVLMVVPIAYLLAWSYQNFYGMPIADTEKASKMIAEIHPFNSLSLVFAALTGVYLMTAGLISGIYDNSVVYNQIPQRIENHPFLNKVFPRKWLISLAKYIGKNLGGLAGNFYLGIFLGTTSVIGFMMGIPLDIRHITFSAGAFALSYQVLEEQIVKEEIIWSVIGILGIGFFNVLVSFGLSVMVALKARRTSFKQFRQLVFAILVYMIKHPLEFFIPSKEKN
ncbi:MAG: site-specific recombinase [Flammeovirgaceae bacterium]